MRFWPFHAINYDPVSTFNGHTPCHPFWTLSWRRPNTGIQQNLIYYHLMHYKVYNPTVHIQHEPNSPDLHALPLGI